MIIKQLTKHYGAKRVVDEVSFEIPKGKVLSLIGPNGAGKSTVMGMISRLVAKDAGLVQFEGKDLAKWNSRDLSKRLAILTQSNNIQMKLTVRELVSFGRFPYCQGRLQEEDRRKVDEALAYMELEAIADQFIDELSGGQRQALTLLMATLVPPKLLLLDEHTAALDPGTAEKVLRITREVVAEHRITTLMVTHNMHQALELGNRTLMMDSGNIILDVRGEERSGLTVSGLLERFRAGAGKNLDNDRILLS